MRRYIPHRRHSTGRFLYAMPPFGVIKIRWFATSQRSMTISEKEETPKTWN